MIDLRDDEALRRAVLEELAWDALVDATGLDVSVDATVVTLIGTVPSLAQKLAAQQAALAVDGVRDVVNGLEVRPPGEARALDSELAIMLRRVLEWDAVVPADELTVSVNDGWVTLEGSVPTVRQRQEAERAVSALAGVRGVTNDITIELGDVGPDEVRVSIEEALIRRALHHANRIKVAVQDGRVTLSGSVDTPGELAAVLGAVSHTLGVEALCDDLTVLEPSTPTLDAAAVRVR